MVMDESHKNNTDKRSICHHHFCFVELYTRQYNEYIYRDYNAKRNAQTVKRTRENFWFDYFAFPRSQIHFCHFRLHFHIIFSFATESITLTDLCVPVNDFISNRVRHRILASVII